MLHETSLVGLISAPHDVQGHPWHSESSCTRLSHVAWLPWKSTSDAEAVPEKGRMAETQEGLETAPLSPFGNLQQFHGGMVLTAKDGSCEESRGPGLLSFAQWPEPLTCLGVRFHCASPWPLPAPGLLLWQPCLGSVLPRSPFHIVHSCLTKLFCTFIPRPQARLIV